MKTRLLLLLAILLSMSGAAFGQYIEIRISVKVVLHPANGTRPPGITDNLINTASARSNSWMDNYLRGYRFRIEEVKDIGGPSQGGASGPSKWFDKNPLNDNGVYRWVEFQNDIGNDSRYLRRSDKVNFYITQGSVPNTGGACPIPGNPNDAGYTACWGLVNDGPFWMVHETGHFFGLCHTFDGCGILGTLPDGADWTRDQIENNARSNVPGFNMLPFDVQQRLIDDTFFNVMSYHNAIPDPNNPGYFLKDRVENRMTELQLDRHADTANGARAAFVSGRTRFVSTIGSDSVADNNNSSTRPYRTLGRSVTAANAAGGDIILLRPGAYNEAITINKPCTLRATRAGAVAIGTSASP